MLICLQSLLCGASVGESTFTCLYAHSPVLVDMKARLFPEEEDLAERMEKLMTIDDQQPKGTPAQIAVFASALALVETTEVLRGIIQNADIYEEEDFVSNTYQIPFFSESHGYVDSLQVLEKALEATTKAEEPKSCLMKALRMILGFQFGFLSIITSMVRRNVLPPNSERMIYSVV